MPTTQAMALYSPLTNLHQYTSLVESYPRIDEAEEQRLARRLQEHDDLDAAWELIASHLRYVVYIARGYTGYGLPQEDLIQEGNIGLMQAVRRFDPDKGVRLVTYATIWIRAQIHEYILKNWRIVKITTTKAKRKLFYKLRSAKKRLAWLNQAEATEIAEALDVSPEDVIEMDGKLYSHDVSFDPSPQADEDECHSPATSIGDERYEPALLVEQEEFVNVATEELHDALRSLDQRSREIIEARWLADDDQKLTLHQLAERYAISAERVRQIENRAIKRLRNQLVARLELDQAA